MHDPQWSTSFDFAIRMASIEELRDAMKENLDQSGTLQRVRAELRAECLRALRGDDISSKPELSSEALVINGGLVRLSCQCLSD